ncbi:hypothetical protein [Flavobacterium muglaense]|uniref:Uncharacterized protein n=1 Tax=Flavobacterium muglaense TaxID=2764716 RepID=A0A923N0T3_9FLAO|nr:hypothetical protein [Flavobacterium muglaense]MBC5838652.1 hypothetical protein [Flavobacterium muglaense]MBC5845214.1 hypothetical protein [Flavobacterium muglaense]
MSQFKRGNLIVFKTHPFIDKHTNIKISAFPEYTSPILIIKEVKDKTFEKGTGRDNGQQLNCIYYNSRDGKFTEKWISSQLINQISFSVENNKILRELDFKKELESSGKELISKNYDNLIRTTYLNKKVVLKSVDLELFKNKVNRTKENGELLETNHLEFLPPVMTVIAFKYSDEKHKYCEKTGLPLIELKCKWYNSSSKTFSESFFHYDILYSITETQNLINKDDLLNDAVKSMEENTFFIFPLEKPFILEGDSDDKKITTTIGQSHSIIFKHYFYQMNYFDFITQKKSTITIDYTFDIKNEIDIFGKRYPSYNNKYKFEISDCKFEIGNYYHIIYKDAFLNVTKRIVKVKDFFIHIKDFKKFKEDYQELDSWKPEKNINFVNFKYLENGKITINLDGETITNNTLPKIVFKDKNLEIMLNTNCLLRRGKIRNFKLSQISEVREIIKGETIFE